MRVDAGGRIPPGGTAGQVLVKASGQDYATEWAAVAAAWGDITGTLSAQTDLQAALDAKQATLISGTNIKTLNGSTILGSGDLVISASAAWGGITGTLSAQTDLQAALNAKVDTAGFAAAVAATAAVTANTAKVTNATHTGDAAGATVLTIQPAAITGKATVTPDGADFVLISDTSDSGALKKALVSSLGGGATGGSATINFGAAPGTNIAEVVVTGQTGIPAGAQVKAWIQGDSTADHNVYTHTRILAPEVALSCENITAGVGFTIVASTELRLTGNVSVRWEWSV